MSETLLGLTNGNADIIGQATKGSDTIRGNKLELVQYNVISEMRYGIIFCSLRRKVTYQIFTIF